MKIYNLDCEVKIQPNGTNCLISMFGDEKAINLTFNGFYNFGAGSNLEFCNHTHTIAVFWSTMDKMHNFFRNLYYFRHVDKYEEEMAASMKGKRGGFENKDNIYYKNFEKEQTDFADKMMKELVEFNTYSIGNFANQDMDFGEAAETSKFGTILAERPDAAPEEIKTHDVSEVVFEAEITDEIQESGREVYSPFNRCADLMKIEAKRGTKSESLKILEMA